MARAGEGNTSARIMLVGECYGEYEERAHSPFQGAAGQELSRMLQEIGITRSECYLTNLVNARPPFSDIEKWAVHKSKRKDITSDMVPSRDRWVKPIVREGFEQLLRRFILFSPISLSRLATRVCGLTGAWGVTKWRGSVSFNGRQEMYPQGLLSPVEQPWTGKLVPTCIPHLMRDFSQRPIVLNDLKRAKKEQHTKEYANEPDWKFIVRPSFETACSTLAQLQDGLDNGTLEWLDFDLETRAGHIACAGLSWSKDEAICIPFMCVEDKTGYWVPEMEAQLVYLLYKVLTHPRVKVRWQNGVRRAIYPRHWHFVHAARDDDRTPPAFWVCPSRSPSSLDVLRPLRLLEGRRQDLARRMSEDQLWRYNGVDCVGRGSVVVEARTIESSACRGRCVPAEVSACPPVHAAGYCGR